MTNSLNFNDYHYVSKGWGYEKWIVNKEEYCGKLLFFWKGKRCSYHYHKLKDETFYVQSGRIMLLWSDLPEFDQPYITSPDHPWMGPEDQRASVTLEKGDSFHIPAGRRHQLIALEDTELFEFSTEHFDEDSYRVIKGD